MKLPWDKEYLKISLHVIVAVAIIYILKLLIDGAAYIIVDFNNVFSGLFAVIKDICKLFSPLIIALIIAYLFDPVVDFFQGKYEIVYKNKINPYLTQYDIYNKFKKNKRKHVSGFKQRTAGTALTYITVAGIIIILITALLNKGGKSDASITESLIKTINSMVIQIGDMLTAIRVQLVKWEVDGYLEQYINELLLEARTFMDGMGGNAIKTITSAGGAVANFFIALVIAFYVMKQKAYLLHMTKDLAHTFLPQKANIRIANLMGDFHVVLSGYIRGQLTDAFIMAVMMSTVLSVIGVDFAIVIGVITGFSNLIPYFGAIIGFVLAVIMALITGPPSRALWAAIGVLVLQQIDGMFIVPKVVGEKVSLSAPLVILSLTVAGRLFGITGMVLAVPCCAMGKILVTRYIARFKHEKTLNEMK